MKAVLLELRNAGGEARIRDLLTAVEPKLSLSTYEKAPYEKSGWIRWKAIVHFYSIDCVKAGYIRKSGGKWYLTADGERALHLPPEEFIRSAQAAYRAWKTSQEKATEADIDLTAEEQGEIVRQAAYEEALAQARAEIEEYINNLGAYDFQKLVAELLRAMGYHVPHVAPPGRDGGIDIVAYKDPLGTTTPRIKVQVKHRDQRVTVKEVRELEGLLRKEGDIGLIVSSGGFSSEVEREIRASTKHIETMDLDRLINLWQEHYDKLSERGKAMLPLIKVYFLAPTEE
jgi:restriction system protein